MTLPIVITETSGLLRPIILTESMLPREGDETTMIIKQRGSTKYYPGSDVPTSQVLGVEHEPISFSGLLEDRRIGFAGAAVATQFLVQQVVKGGKTCIFNWGPIVRRVRWLRAEFRMIELSRISYHFELEVLDDGIGLLTRILPGVARIASVVAAVVAAGLAIGQLVVFAKGSPSVSIKPAKRDAIKRVNDDLDLVVSNLNEGQLSLDKVGVPGSVADTGAATEAHAKISSAADASQRADNTSRQLAWRDDDGNAFELVAAGGSSVLAARREIKKTILEVGIIKASVADLAKVPFTGLVYIVADGDSLQRLALRFYGTVDRWPEILTANKKCSPAVTPGERLLIPDVPQSDRAVAAP